MARAGRALAQCSCSIDVIASILPYDRYVSAETVLSLSQAPGHVPVAGTICGAANVAPSWVVRIYDAYLRGDLVAARADQDRLFELVTLLRAGGVFPASIKAACHLQGICEPWCATPVQPLDDQLEARLRDRLDAWGLLTPAIPR